MQKEDEYASVKEDITTIYHENRGRYGYRRITAELRRRISSWTTRLSSGFWKSWA
jgi:hypothetical protein